MHTKSVIRKSTIKALRTIFDLVCIVVVEFLCLCFGLLQRVPKRAGLCLVIPPDNPGSLGDEAMIKVVLRDLIPNDASVYFLGWSRGVVGTEWGSTIYVNRNPISIFRLLTKVRHFEKVVIVGADVLDGYYSIYWSYFRLRMALLWVGQSINLKITPFSFNKKPSYISVRLIKSLAQYIPIYSRDSFSKKRLEDSGVNVQGLTDLAFLYSKTDFLCAARNSSGFVVINISPMMFGDSGVRLECIDALINIINSTNLKFKLLPHDSRPWSDDAALLRKIYEKINDNSRARVVFCEVPKSTLEVYRELNGASLVITGRMHLAIAALSNSKPIICYTYQDKFEGILKDIGLPYNPIVHDSVEVNTKKLIAYISNNREKIEEEISKGVAFNRGKLLSSWVQ